MGAVYFIRNEIKPRIYIGKDENDDSAGTRLKNHLSGANFHCRSLRKDINLHGLSNFTTDVIETVPDKEELRRVEEWWIRVYNAADPRFGYNTIGKIHLPSDEAIKQYQGGLLKADPRRYEIYRQLPSRGQPLSKFAGQEYQLFAANEASSVENDAQFNGECKGKGLRLATKKDIGAGVIYPWKTFSNRRYTGTLKTFGRIWATIVNDNSEMRAKYPLDEIEIGRNVIFVRETEN